MYERKTTPQYYCTVDFALSVFGGKWKPRLLCILGHAQQVRYHKLKAQMTGISDAALADNLKAMQDDGLVTRQQFNEMPIRVEYALTALGKSVLPVLDGMSTWAVQHSDRAMYSGTHFEQVHAQDFTDKQSPI